MQLQNFKSESATMSSLEVSKITGKLHKNILRDIRKLEKDLLDSSLSFERSSYVDVNNATRDCFSLSKKETLLLVSGYSVQLRLSIINRWEELENTVMHRMPQSFPEALRQLADVAEERDKLAFEKFELEKSNEIQESQIRIAAPKVDYYDSVLKSKSTYLITIIAKELGYSAVELNRKLADLRVQFKVGNTWVLYKKYQDLEYVKIDTVVVQKGLPTEFTATKTVWTEKGREFIHKLMSHLK
jgi:Rha family phage regulatory protein